MLELIGYLVACSGAEETDARTAACFPQQFLRKDDRADCAGIDDESIAGIAVGKTAISDTIRTIRTGSPITIVYARENFPDRGIADAIPGLVWFGRGSQECQVTGTGARRT